VCVPSCKSEHRRRHLGSVAAAVIWQQLFLLQALYGCLMTKGAKRWIKLCVCSCSVGGGLTARGRRSNRPTPVSWEWDLVCNKWISTLSCGLEYLYECYWVCRTYLCILSDTCDSLWCIVFIDCVCRLNGGGGLTGLQPRSDHPYPNSPHLSLLSACHAICIMVLFF
jgi:hypothetical protein